MVGTIRVRRELRSGDSSDVDYEELYNNICSVLSLEGKSKPTFYEVITGYCRGYIDVDMKIENDKETRLTHRMNMIVAIRKKLSGYEYHLLDGCGKVDNIYKLSFHIIFPKIYFKSGTDMIDFVKKLDLPEVDYSVYKNAGKQQLFRIPYCAKTTNDRRLIYLLDENNRRIKNIADVGAERFGEFLITNIPKKDDDLFSDSDDSTQEPNEIEEDEDEPEEEKWAFQEKFEKLMPNTRIIGRGKKEKNSQIIDLMKSSDECPIAKRVHQHNRNYIVHNLKSGAYDLRCHDEDCQNKKIILRKKELESKNPEIDLPEPTNDEPQEILYCELLKMAFDPFVEGDFNEAGLSRLFCATYKDIIKISDIEGNGYYWGNKRWRKYSASTLLTFISTLFEEQLRKMLEFVSTKTKADDDAYYKRIMKALKMSYKKINSKAVMKNIFDLAKAENTQLFMKTDIFDAKPYLVGFENGVLDLNTAIFREYEKEDLVTMSTGYDFRSPTDAERDDWHKYICEVMPVQEEREFLLKVLSTCLYGQTLENLFLLIGNGRNSKDTLITTILKNVLGPDYYYKGPSTLLTTSFKGGASPEVHNMNRKRCVILTEPDKKVSWKCANIKEITGASEINARTLYKTQTITQICATFMVLLNSIPAADDMDNALASRMCGIPFRAQYLTDEKLEQLPEGTPYVYKGNNHVKSVGFVESVKYALLEDIVKRFAVFKSEGGIIQNKPESIKELTREYIESCDEFLQWFRETYEYVDDEGKFVKVVDVYSAFKSSELYINSNKSDKRRLTRQKLIKDITDNPNIRLFYRDRKKINGKDHFSIILKHRLRDANNANADFGVDSDDE